MTEFPGKLKSLRADAIRAERRSRRRGRASAQPSPSLPCSASKSVTSIYRPIRSLGLTHFDKHTCTVQSSILRDTNAARCAILVQPPGFFWGVIATDIRMGSRFCSIRLSGSLSHWSFSQLDNFRDYTRSFTDRTLFVDTSFFIAIKNTRCAEHLKAVTCCIEIGELDI